MASPGENLRVLIVAEHASARFGGEAILPLHYFRMLRQRGVEAWLLVHGRTQPELEEYLPDQRERMHFIPDLWIHRALWAVHRRLPKRIATFSIGALSHLITQRLQRRIAKRLIREHKIDVVHEPIPVSPKLPSAMFNLGAPVIIGPMNGGMHFPPAYRQRQGTIERLFMTAGRGLASFMNRMLPGKRRARRLLVANERTKAALPASLVRTPVEILVENAVDLDLWRPPAETAASDDGKPRFAYVGALIDWKAVDILLDAFAQAHAQTPMELHVFGDGVKRAELEAQAQRLGLGDDVVFHGFTPQPEVARQLAQLDGLLLCSLYECGGAVVLEAMALGKPVVAPNWGGPTDYVDESCGILVDPVARPEYVAALSDAIQRLAGDAALRACLGHAGRRRVVEQFSWNAKIDRMLEIYASVVATR